MALFLSYTKGFMDDNDLKVSLDFERFNYPSRADTLAFPILCQKCHKCLKIIGQKNNEVQSTESSLGIKQLY